MSNDEAVAANSWVRRSTSMSPVTLLKAVRERKRPEWTSSNCWCSVMSHPCW